MGRVRQSQLQRAPSPLQHPGARRTPVRGIARLGSDPRALLQEGDESERHGDFVASAGAYTAAAACDDPCVAAEARFRLGRVAWRQGRLDDALVLYERARAMAEECGSNETLAAAEIGIGAVHCERGAYTQARACYEVARSLSPNAAMRGKIHLNLGAIAALEGDAPQAAALYARSIRDFEEARNDDGLALTLHNLGILHASLGEWDAAEEAYARCEATCERLGTRTMLASVLLKRIELLCARDRLDEASRECERVLTLLAELGDEVGRVEAFRLQGHAFRRLGRHEAAEMRLKDAARIAARLQLARAEAQAAEELGALLAECGRDGEARTWLERARARAAS